MARSTFRNRGGSNTFYLPEEQEGVDAPLEGLTNAAKIAAFAHSMGTANDKLRNAAIERSGLKSDKYSANYKDFDSQINTPYKLFENTSSRMDDIGLFGYLEDLLQPTYNRVRPTKKGLAAHAISLFDTGSIYKDQKNGLDNFLKALESGDETALAMFNSAKDDVAVTLADDGYNVQQVSQIMDMNPKDIKIIPNINLKNLFSKKGNTSLGNTGEKKGLITKFNEEVSKFTADQKHRKNLKATSQYFTGTGFSPHLKSERKRYGEYIDGVFQPLDDVTEFQSVQDMWIGMDDKERYEVQLAYSQFIDMSKKNFPWQWRKKVPNVQAFIKSFKDGDSVEDLFTDLKDKGWNIDTDNLTTILESGEPLGNNIIDLFEGSNNLGDVFESSVYKHAPPVKEEVEEISADSSLLNDVDESNADDTLISGDETSNKEEEIISGDITLLNEVELPGGDEEEEEETEEEILAEEEPIVKPSEDEKAPAEPSEDEETSKATGNLVNQYGQPIVAMNPKFEQIYQSKSTSAELADVMKRKPEFAEYMEKRYKYRLSGDDYNPVEYFGLRSLSENVEHARWLSENGMDMTDEDKLLIEKYGATEPIPQADLDADDERLYGWEDDKDVTEVGKPDKPQILTDIELQRDKLFGGLEDLKEKALTNLGNLKDDATSFSEEKISELDKILFPDDRRREWRGTLPEDYKGSPFKRQRDFKKWLKGGPVDPTITPIEEGRDVSDIIDESGMLLDDVTNKVASDLDLALEDGSLTDSEIEQGNQMLSRFGGIKEVANKIKGNVTDTMADAIAKSEETEEAIAKYTGMEALEDFQAIAGATKELTDKDFEVKDLTAAATIAEKTAKGLGKKVAEESIGKVLTPVKGAVKLTAKDSTPLDRVGGAMDIAGVAGADANPYYAAVHVGVKALDMLEDLLT